MSRRSLIPRIFELLYDAYGPQHWWPGETPFEVAVGAVLTQNTNWGNVERAIGNLKSAGVLAPRKMAALRRGELAELIRPSGYYNLKADRLMAFVEHLCGNYGASMSRMARADKDRLRPELLSIKGIGPETADSILLYALAKPEFVIDAYTKRVASRHGLMDSGRDYHEFKSMFEGALDGYEFAGVGRVGLFNEYHALLVRVAKEHCRKREPMCSGCPLESLKA